MGGGEVGQLMGVGTLHRSNPDIHILVAEEMDLGTLAVAVEVESRAAEDTLVGTLNIHSHTPNTNDYYWIIKQIQNWGKFTIVS